MSPANFTTRVDARERSHRHVVMTGVVVLIVLGVLPVLVDHAPGRLESALSGVDHLGALCLAALHVLLAPVHGGFHLLLAGGIAYAVWDRFRAWRRLSEALAPLEAQQPREGDAFWAAAVDAGVQPRRIRVVSGLPNPAFTVGAFTPVIYVAAELPDRLSDSQLRAVLGHEAAHVKRLDPLRLSLLRALACALFWIPALARLVEDLRDDSEILADDAAVTQIEPLVLASALLVLAEWRGPTVPLPQGAAGFCDDTLLERRVRRLLGEDVQITSHVTRRSLGVATLLLGVVWASGVLMTHPLEAASPSVKPSDGHCASHAESPLGHLFCRRGAPSPDCPHARAVAEAHHEG
ncbi:MAG: M56 family metallopeptidase [Gemmatimonadota bacterium]